MDMWAFTTQGGMVTKVAINCSGAVMMIMHMRVCRLTT